MPTPTVRVFVGSGIFFSCNKKIPELFVTALFYEKPSLVLRIVSLTADAAVSVAISPPCHDDAPQLVTEAVSEKTFVQSQTRFRKTRVSLVKSFF